MNRISEREMELAREGFDEALHALDRDFGVKPTTNGAKVIARYMAEYRGELSDTANEIFNERIIELECALEEIKEKTARAVDLHNANPAADDMDPMINIIRGIILIIRSAQLG